MLKAAIRRLLPRTVRWSADAPATVAVLDGRFAVATQRWPSLAATTQARLAAVVAQCEAAGHAIEAAVPLPGFDRVHVYDPFGNRLELMQRS